MKNSIICIIGNLNIDLIIREVNCLPMWGQEVIGKSHIQVSSGQAAYTGIELKNLKIPTSIISVVGNDLEGKQILSDLEKYGINIDGCTIIDGEKTGITVAVVRDDGERAFISDPGCLNRFSKSMILNNWKQVLSADYIMFAGIFFLPDLSISDFTFLAKKIKSENKTTILDTGWDINNWQNNTIKDLNKLLSYIDIFLPNLDEAYAITSKGDPKSAAQSLHNAGIEFVVIKMGANGSFASHNNQALQLPALSVDVYDTVGAGDVFNAGFLMAYIKGCSLKTCIAFGNATSALYVSRSENRFPSFKEVNQLVKFKYKLPRKLIKNLEEYD